ncbi:hypothetical protein VTI74DRAFT_10751 [Chaetomium olivicolor]
MKLPNLPTMSFSVMLVIRITQGLFASLVLILSGFVANWYNTTTTVPTPSEIKFLIFGAIWSCLSLLCIEVMIPRFLPRTLKTHHHLLLLPLEATNALFYFAGFIALSVFLSKLLFCRGAVCHVAQADVALAAFSFAVWTASAVITGLESVRAGRKGGVMHAGTGAVPMKEAAA